MNNTILPSTAAILVLLAITLFGGQYWLDNYYIPTHPEIHRSSK